MIEDQKILCEKPLIIICRRPLDIAEILDIKDEKVVFIKRISCNISIKDKGMKFYNIENEYKIFKEKYPNCELYNCCNTEYQYYMLKDIPCIFADHNCLINEECFSIQNVEKTYDAVMIAKMEKFKRHYLAKEIKSLALITNPSNENNEYAKDVERDFAHATFCNRDKFVSNKDVERIINQSKVGLILSAFEGANRATVEYLLCGLPVVTTESLGGRSYYYIDEAVRVVPPDSLMVKNAVDGIKDQKEISPELIRQITIDRMKIRRKGFIDAVQRIINDNGGDLDFSEHYYKIRNRDMLYGDSIDKIKALIDYV